MLTGNARHQDGHLIAAATVYDTAAARQIWTELFDRPEGPGTQLTVVQHIYESFWQETIDAEGTRAMREHPDSLDKRDLMSAALATRCR